jgi:hypothetical protein
MPLILNLDTVILLVRCHVQEFLRVLNTSEGVLFDERNNNYTSHETVPLALAIYQHMSEVTHMCENLDF